MITSLLAHEFRRTRGVLGVVLGGATLLVLAGSLLVLAGWDWLASFGMAVGLMALAGLLPVAGLALVVDYWRSAYGRTGYLTHSLPVKGATIYGVRLLYGLILSVVGVLLVPVLALPLAVAAVSQEARAAGDVWGHLVRAANEVLAGVEPLLLTVGVLAVIAMVWFGLVTFYFAATVGSGSRFARLGVAGPVVVYVLVYVVLQVLPFLGIVVLPWGVGEVGDGFGVVRVDWWSAALSGEDVNAMPLGFIPVYLLALLVFVVWTARSWNTDVTLR